MDKDLGKNHLCDKKHGTGRLISATSITKKTTQQNETLEISTGGAFKHFKTNEGTYETIGQQLKKLIDGQFINKNMLKKFFHHLVHRIHQGASSTGPGGFSGEGLRMDSAGRLVSHPERGNAICATFF